MNLEEKTTKYLWVTFGLLTIAIIVYVLFQYPQPGVADQGDFDRVMFVSGLEIKADQAHDPNFVRFLDYTVTDYKISESSLLTPLGKLRATSISYVIALITLLCRIFGQDTFKTTYLAIAYVLMYVSAIYVIVKYLNIEGRLKLAFLISIALLVFLDGNYLVWFNSLYGEPMMITTLMLYIAAWVYYIYNRQVLKSEESLFGQILFVYITALLFLGSKIQVISALPIILFMVGLLFWENRQYFKLYQAGVLCFLYLILIAYPLELHFMNKEISKDTQYDSVFYGILKDSPTPAQDLIDMGLDPSLAVDAGKHSFLPKDQYVRYVPHSQITQAEFYSKMSNGRLVKFYLTHPSRLLQGMQYTASQAFFTSSFLGKYSREYSETPVREFNRFTAWSSFREEHLPKNLWFIAAMFAAVLITSLVTYVKNQPLSEIRSRIQLLWGIMLIGLLQFPMPFVGNGQADTSKQLYLFNFVFDIILVVSFCWCLNQLLNYTYAKKGVGKSQDRIDFTQSRQLIPNK